MTAEDGRGSRAGLSGPVAHTTAASVPAATLADPNDRYTAQEIHTFLVAFYGEHGPDDFARAYGIPEHVKEKVAPGRLGTRSGNSAPARNPEGR